MQFAPDGEHIATTGGDGAIRVWSWRADRLGEPPPNGESLTMLGEIEDAHGGINDQRNFDTLGATFLVLLQCLTSDGWSTVMAAAMKDEESGGCSDARGDCGTPAAVPYFLSLQVLGSFIFLNLVVAAGAGALIPMVMKRMGIDPALAGSVVLTTVTDIVGFMAFLGLATLLYANLVV